MKFEVNGSEVFASTGGRPFDKTKPLINFYKIQEKFISINGVGGFNEVTNRLISTIDSKI